MYYNYNLLSEPDCGIVAGGTFDLFPKRNLNGVVAGGTVDKRKKVRMLMQRPFVNIRPRNKQLRKQLMMMSLKDVKINKILSK